MNVRPIYAASFAIAALGALAVSAQDENLTPYYDESGYVAVPEDTAPAPTLTSPSEAPLTAEPVVSVVNAEATTPPYAEPPINVTISPEDRDALINKDVVEALSSDSRLSGKIGVETYRQVVTLTGRVTNPAQVERAGTIARGVIDVNDVENLVRARVGG